MKKLNTYILYTSSICPFSRKVRFFLDEFSAKYEEVEIKYWERNRNFLKLNPASETPVLREVENDIVICDSHLICEYITKQKENIGEINYFNLYGVNLVEEYEIKRLEMWFDKKFYNEITRFFIAEYFLKTFTKASEPVDKILIKIALGNLLKHISYIEFLLQKRSWLAGEMFSVADIAASSQISLIDYLGFIEWNRFIKFKEWYISTKQKLGFRKILEEKITGFSPSIYYKELDF